MEQKDNMGCETTLSYVISFNNTLLHTKHIKSSPQYNFEIDLNVLVTPNQWWASRSVLFEAVNTFSLLLCFHPLLKHKLSAVTITGIKNTSKAMSPGSCGLDALSISNSEHLTIPNLNQPLITRIYLKRSQKPFHIQIGQI
jgi:hypothetical protein